MKDFFVNEWNLFLDDMQELGEFFLQPVTFKGLFFPNKEMLNPTIEEIEEKASTGGFWKNQWNLFKEDINNAVEFLTQPVTFK